MTEHRKEYAKEYRKTDVYKERQQEYMKKYKNTETYKEQYKGYMEKYNTDAKKEIKKGYTYKKKYGITLDDYNFMFASQNGCCKICGTHQAELKQTLAVDHCHDTLKVRGLLCNNCNTALGKFKDDINLLSKAVEYLKLNK